MAVYAEPGDVRLVLTRDPDRTQGTAASMLDENFEAAIADAQAEIDAVLRSRYAVPFDPAPALVHTITVAIAAWVATLSYYQEKQIPEDSAVVRRCDWARGLLMSLRSGEIDLGDDDGPGPDPGPSPGGGGGFGSPVNSVPEGLLTGCPPGWWP